MFFEKYEELEDGSLKTALEAVATKFNYKHGIKVS